MDNRSALITAEHAATDISDIRPKSRHYALREFQVKDEAHRIGFCATGEMRADGLTKMAPQAILRKLCGPIAFICLVGYIG